MRPDSDVGQFWGITVVYGTETKRKRNKRKKSIIDNKKGESEAEKSDPDASGFNCRHARPWTFGSTAPPPPEPPSSTSSKWEGTDRGPHQIQKVAGYSHYKGNRQVG